MKEEKTLVMAMAAVVATFVVLASAPQHTGAETVPAWIKTNADLWTQGQIGDDTFTQGIQYLVSEQIIDVPPADHDSAQRQEHQKDEGIPAWIKNVAALWVSGQTGDSEFLDTIEYLAGIGVIAVDTGEPSAETDGMQQGAQGFTEDDVLMSLQADLEACQEIAKAPARIECENDIEEEITIHGYKSDAKVIQVGPVNYYWKGIGSEGNTFEMSPGGQALLSIRMLVENTSDDRVALKCTSPQICNYDVTDGSAAFKYSGMDFTSGQIVLNPGGFREFNILFGPNIGYGGTKFVYDPAKEYHFRITEDFGRAQIPLDLG